MASIPKKVAERLQSGIKRFQLIIKSALDRNINESNSVLIITDMLVDIFAYEKYFEINNKHGICLKTYLGLQKRIKDRQLQDIIEDNIMQRG